MTVIVDCPECKATGLYHGYSEPSGVAVVCTKCKGSGGIPMPKFTRRKYREDIGYVLIAGKQIGYRVFLERFQKKPTA
jgi:hypothetical protein